MTADEQRLRRRLQRVVALHEGAATEGERQAAANARDRLVARLRQVRAADPVVHFVHRDLQRLGVDRPPEPPEVPLPSHGEMARALVSWERGVWDAQRVREWAAWLVDAVDLPADPCAEGAVRAEVLLQLAMMDRVPLQASDVPQIRRFLRTSDWGVWFEWIARVSPMAG